ncbi:hypothetical protein [Planomonospora parontospora]|uniref:hypothetical protein n=1 Tax=Planomonospora parontospora TaxID=58119 RepID=UPI00166FA8FD|nr:hypothetical protein [Planomonospora parontospora]GGL41659.1 hypothetical protein GCM10014719_48680 [Planomonospora parontospora subsp. antibiotica]GII18273.1 hypothetical protein Ppa05_49990 [Planomonospora parontospora subsp. antibiotica]
MATAGSESGILRVPPGNDPEIARLDNTYIGDIPQGSDIYQMPHLGRPLYFKRTTERTEWAGEEPLPVFVYIGNTPPGT